jgi:hypothetical protein
VGLGFLVRLRFALRSFAVWCVCAIAPSFVSGLRAFSSVSLCKSVSIFITRPPLLALGPPPAPWTLLVSLLPSDQGPGGMSCSCSRAGLWWVTFPSSTLPFVPMSVESFGRRWAPALMLIGDVADQAVQADGRGLSRAAFVSGALRELSVALCQGNASLCRSGAFVATRAAGWTPMRCLARPSAEFV